MNLFDGSPLRFHVDPDPTPSHGIPRPPLQPHDMIGLNAIIQRRRWRIHEPRSHVDNVRVAEGCAVGNAARTHLGLRNPSAPTVAGVRPPATPAAEIYDWERELC